MSLHRGAYGGLTEFENVSASMTFCPGECLVGKAMSDLRPIATEQLNTTEIMRGEVATKVGLTNAVCVPIVAGKQLRAVFAMFN